MLEKLKQNIPLCYISQWQQAKEFC